jgi:hypothetical protein
MLYNNPVVDLLSYDLNTIEPAKSHLLLDKYLHYILYGNKSIKVFTGIPRTHTKYMVDFRKMLTLNKFNPDELNIPIEVDDDVTNYTAFFVFVDGRGHTYGSFQNAYLYSAMVYLESVILYEDDIIKDIADNVKVYFGQVLVKDNKMFQRDLVDVVNHTYYTFMNDDLPFE